MIALQLSLIYIWSAIDKISPGFLSGARLEQISMWYYFGSDYPPVRGFHELMVLLSWATPILEFALGVGMLFRPTRKWLIVPGLLLHAAFFVLLPVLTYTATMWLLYLACFDADSIHRFIDGIHGYSYPTEPAKKDAATRAG